MLRSSFASVTVSFRLSLGAVVALVVLGAPGARGELLSHWPLDGDLDDAGLAGADALWEGIGGPAFEAGPSGDAVLLTAPDAGLVLPHVGQPGGAGLPLRGHSQHTLAFWLRSDADAGAIAFAEVTTLGSAPAFEISVGDGGRVRVALHDRSGEVLLDGLSTGVVFDGEWHHLAWTEDVGVGALWIDGVRDAAEFVHEPRAGGAVEFDETTVGFRGAPSPCCRLFGAVDEIRVYDHALSADEIAALARVEGCPAQGDTHCGNLTIEPPEGGLGAPGTYLAVVGASRDDSGDPIRYIVTAESDAGEVLRVGPTEENIAELMLDAGTWTITARVDDDGLCDDEAADAVCDARVVTIDCPAEGDTHCGELRASGPADGGPGTWMFDVVDAVDDSGDPILYTFIFESEEGRVRRLDPRRDPFVDIDLTEGRWTVAVEVDDDPACGDLAEDAVCSIEVFVGCDLVGDTHCLGIDVVPGEGIDAGPGEYAVRASSVDDSGDVVLHRFRLENSARGIVHETGWLPSIEARFLLAPGDWVARVTADDSLLCADRADDDTCETLLTVDEAAPELVGYWAFDGDLVDDSGFGSDALFLGDAAPAFTTGHDGRPDGALLATGEGCVRVPAGRALPARLHPAHTVAFWVRSDDATGGTVWHEGDGETTFRIAGPDDGASPYLEVTYIAADASTPLRAVRSTRPVFDGAWHHVAWVETNGNAGLWIDGVRDEVDVGHRAAPGRYRETTIACEDGESLGRLFRGAIDDVRVYSWALGEDEIRALVPEPPGCDGGDTHCLGLEVSGPAGGVEGRWNLLASASDGSGDAPRYIFRVEDGSGRVLQVGPTTEREAEFDLTPGTWMASVIASDDFACHEEAADARCERAIEVAPRTGTLLAWWPFDGDLLDASGAAIEAFARREPRFVADRRGEPGSAIAFDGGADGLDVPPGAGFPVTASGRYSIAFWVRGEPQDDRWIFVEAMGGEEGPALTIGSHPRGSDGRIAVSLRDAAGSVVLSRRLSDGVVLDGAWRHVAWVVSDGDAALWIDGIRDGAAFAHDAALLPGARTSIGGRLVDGLVRGAFAGDLDDLRVWDRPLSAEEIRVLAEVPGEVRFRRGDGNGDGGVNLSDAVFILAHLFLGGEAPGCREAADGNDDGGVDIADPIAILSFLFLGGAALPAPGTGCGPDGPGSPSVGCALPGCE